MSKNKELADYIMDQLSDLGNVRNIPMMGGYIFYYEKKGKRISQFHMSTGENLLISILNSISIRKKERDNIEKPCMFF